VDGHGMVVCWEGHLCGMSFPRNDLKSWGWTST
jgi:hypothetical protein